jgi:hypothetical protein
VAVLEEGMKYTPISISPEQAQFLETGKFQIDEIAGSSASRRTWSATLRSRAFPISSSSPGIREVHARPVGIRWEQSMQRALLHARMKRSTSSSSMWTGCCAAITRAA